MTLLDFIKKNCKKVLADDLLANFTRTKRPKNIPKIYYRLMIEKQIMFTQKPYDIHKFPAGCAEIGDLIKVNSRFREVIDISRDKKYHVIITFSSRLTRTWANMYRVNYKYNKNYSDKKV